MKTFSKHLIRWYKIHKRDLPWRNTNDPFKIWLSEIILQQTRVNQGLNYYYSFINRFQDIRSLALAQEEEILKLWQGLGYYSRARNLHLAAKQIVNNFQGNFPKDYHKIKSLKGIGDYTAAAIASIAFNQVYPVLDGNVYRVISRFSMIQDSVNSATGKKKIYQILNTLIDQQEPGTFNQALMELGAMICTPARPGCELCPLKTMCKAFRQNKTSEFPVKSKKEKPIDRYFHYLVVVSFRDNTPETIIYQRKDNDIWSGLFEFPLIEAAQPLTETELIHHPDFIKFMASSDYIVNTYSKLFIHKLTHRNINARFLILTLNDLSLLSVNKSIIIVNINHLFKYPVSRLTEKFISNKLLFNFL